MDRKLTTLTRHPRCAGGARILRRLQEEAPHHDRGRAASGRRSTPPETEVPPPPSTAPKPGRTSTAEVLAQDIAALNKKGYLTDAYFDYDQSDLREDARSALAADAEWLKRYPTVQVLIEGHCDERGTGAYNLALGDRRANAAKRVPRLARHRRLAAADGLLRQGAALLHGIDRELLAAEPARASRHHGQIA